MRPILTAIAAADGDLGRLRSLHAKGCSLTESTCISAAASGHFECLKYAVDVGCPLSWRALDVAICGRHTEIIEYLIARWYKETKSLPPMIWANLLRHMNFVFFKKVHDLFIKDSGNSSRKLKLTAHPLTAAIEMQCKEGIEYLVDHGVLPDEHTVVAAFEYPCSLDILQSRFTNHPLLLSSFLSAAVTNGDLTIVKWLDEWLGGIQAFDEYFTSISPLFTRLYTEAQRDCVRYLMTRGFTWANMHPNYLLDALCGDDAAAVQFALETGILDWSFHHIRLGSMHTTHPLVNAANFNMMMNNLRKKDATTVHGFSFNWTCLGIIEKPPHEVINEASTAVRVYMKAVAKLHPYNTVPRNLFQAMRPAARLPLIQMCGVPYYWQRVRKYGKQLFYGWKWYEEYQIQSCKSGGAGRRHDQEMFEAQFVVG